MYWMRALMFEDSINRPDEPNVIRRHKGKFDGATALIILGGPSGRDWKEAWDTINPDVVITCNGATSIPADYWVIGENLNRAFVYAMKGNERDQKYIRVFQEENQAKFRLINWQNWMPNTRRGMQSVGSYFGLHDQNIIRFNRVGYDQIDDSFSLREYGMGLFFGWRFKKRKELGCRTDWRVGTVAIHCLHLAGILGCAEVHTIGLDLCFEKGKHHWWKGYPKYEPDSFRTEKVFTTYEGLETQHDWIEGAEFIAEIEPIFKKAGMDWKDHSNGLLSKMGVWCAA